MCPIWEQVTGDVQASPGSGSLVELMFDHKPPRSWSKMVMAGVPHCWFLEPSNLPVPASFLSFVSACPQWTLVHASRGMSGVSHSGTLAAVQTGDRRVPWSSSRRACAWPVAHAGAPAPSRG
jgi:hypothetical protein